MLQPNVKNVFRVPVNGVNFVVMAYRQLTETEMLEFISSYFRSAKRKPRKGQIITILTVCQ